MKKSVENGRQECNTDSHLPIMSVEGTHCLDERFTLKTVHLRPRKINPGIEKLLLSWLDDVGLIADGDWYRKAPERNEWKTRSGSRLRYFNTFSPLVSSRFI